MNFSKEDLRDLNNLFNQVKDKSEDDFNTYEKLPDGNYNAIVDDLEVTDSKSGKPMFVVSFKILADIFSNPYPRNLFNIIRFYFISCINLFLHCIL